MALTAKVSTDDMAMACSSFYMSANTGTVIGVSANIFGSGFPRNFIPSFSWGGSGGTTTYKTQKAFETAEIVMARRKMEFTEEEAKILEHVFEETKKYRRE